MKRSGHSRLRRASPALLALGLAGLLHSQYPSKAPAAPEKPRANLLLIVAQGLGTQLGSYGQPVKTPNIDRLAGLGRRFERAYAQYPLGGPARVALMTGWRPETSGAFRDKASLREHARSLTPLQEVLRKHGYFTARVGEVYGGQPEREMKWDLAAEPPGSGAGAEWAAARAAQVLAEKAAAPLFLAVGLGRPPGWKLPERYAALHPPAEIQVPPLAATPPSLLPAIALEKPDREARPGGVERPEPAGVARIREVLAAQRGYAAWLDAQVGVLLAALDKAKLWETSAVVLVGDGGPDLLGHGMLTRGDLLFDDMLRAPLIVAAPGLARPGAPTPRLVELVDVHPTLVELAGLPAVERIEGTSLLPLLADPERAVKTAAFSVVRRTGGQLGRSVRTDRFRYTEWPDGSEELYDHAQDPGEHTNLAQVPEHAGALAQLKKRLEETRAAPAQAAAPAERPARARKPNVLLIVADDMNARLGCYGYDVVTPHLDRLARSGRRFERAYCQVAMCSPSRTSFLSGRRPERLGIWDNLEPPKPRLAGATPLHEHFKAHGYFTARVGKHFHQSFDAAFTWDVAEHAPHSSEQEEEEEDEEPRQRRSRRRDGPDAASWSVPTDRPDEQEPDGLRARRAAQLIEEHKDGPFFIALGFAKPHLRWVAPRKYFDLYPPERMRVPEEPADDFRDIPQIAVEHDAVEHPGHTLLGPPGPDVPRSLALSGYSAAVSFVDAQIGVVFETLDRLKLWDDTIVVVTGDHGFQLGEHGGLLRKDTLFEEALRVPLLIWAPGLAQPGAPTSSLAELIDLYPTLTDLAGLPQPKGLEGKSLAPVLQDPARVVKTAAFSAARRRPPTLGWSIRTERYRYTEWPDGSRELYDHETDPGERANLAGAPAQARTLADLRERLQDGWRAALVGR